MLGFTHLLFGLLVGTVFSVYFGNDVMFLFFAALGALFPDIDHPQSILGRKFKGLSWFVKHRGVLHSLFSAAIFSGVLVVLLRIVGTPGETYAFAFFLGYLSHLFLDGTTRAGIRLFYPSKLKFRGRRKTGSWSEKLFQGVIVVLLFLHWL